MGKLAVPESRARRRLTTAALLLAALFSLLVAPAALAQSRDFDLPKGEAAARLASWSKITGIRVELGPAIPANLLKVTTTNAIKGPMRPYQALNKLLEGTPIIILAERLDVVTLGARASKASVLLDSQPLPSSTAAERAQQEQIRRDLAFAFAPDVIARLLAVPSLAPPYAIGLRLDRGRYLAVALVSPPDGGPARLCEAPIAADLGDRLAAAWRKVVAKNVPRRPRGLEGTAYTFAFRRAGAERQRELFEPAPATPEGRLVAIGRAIQTHCAAPTRATTAALGAQVARLEQALRAAPV